MVVFSSWPNKNVSQALNCSHSPVHVCQILVQFYYVGFIYVENNLAITA